VIVSFNMFLIRPGVGVSEHFFPQGATIANLPRITGQNLRGLVFEVKRRGRAAPLPARDSYQLQPQDCVVARKP